MKSFVMTACMGPAIRAVRFAGAVTTLLVTSVMTVAELPVVALFVSATEAVSVSVPIEIGCTVTLIWTVALTPSEPIVNTTVPPLVAGGGAEGNVLMIGCAGDGV